MADIAITLPANLWQKIVSGEKDLELRKSLPKRIDPMVSRVYVILKGTSRVAGYFDYCGCVAMDNREVAWRGYGHRLGITEDWFLKYTSNCKQFFFWKVGYVHVFVGNYSVQGLLGLWKNPQSFAYVNL